MKDMNKERWGLIPVGRTLSNAPAYPFCIEIEISKWETISLGIRAKVPLRVEKGVTIVLMKIDSGH